MSRRESGYALAALVATVTVMMVLMAAAVPSWKYVVKNDREEELIFRGGQIADAIRRFQAKNGNALPASIDVLVKGKYLRKAYKDPMTKDGKWRLIRQGESIGAPSRPGAPGTPSPGPFASPATSPGGGRIAAGAVTATLGSGAPGTSVGAFVGVATLSTEKGLRLFNNRERYSEWFIVAGQPRVVGNRVVGGPQPAAGPGGRTQPQPRPSGPVQPIR